MRTFCGEAGICGVGIFWSRFSDFQLFLLEILLPLVLVLVRFGHLDRMVELPTQGELYSIRVEEK